MCPEFTHALSRPAALLAEPARAAILSALMNEVRLPAGELARIAGIAPQTASAHLAKLCDAGLLAVEVQGRHRYFKLANADVAEAIETLGALAPAPRRAAADFALRQARICYQHLAGAWGVRLEQALRTKAWVEKTELGYRLTETGTKHLRAHGLLLANTSAALEGRACIDWTERRHHIGGRLGRELLSGLRRLDWCRAARSGRALIITAHGGKSLQDLIGAIEKTKTPDRSSE